MLKNVLAALAVVGSCGIANTADLNSPNKPAFEHQEVVCLANILWNEARGELRGHRKLAAMIFIARRDDLDSQWPRTLCGIAAQKGQVSGLQDAVTPHPERPMWDQMFVDAQDVYFAAWQTQLLPRGWECVRYYKMSDAKIATLSLKAKQQLGIADGGGLAYFKTLQPVGDFGVHTAYRDPKRCIKPLPTT